MLAAVVRRAGEGQRGAAELLAPTFVSLFTSPASFDLDDPDEGARVVRDRMLAGILA